jgi:hypothetical protein
VQVKRIVARLVFVAGNPLFPGEAVARLFQGATLRLNAQLLSAVKATSTIRIPVPTAFLA